MSRTHKTAQGIAALGRGRDNMLVHMSHNEVRGLQKLALATGGSLSINPKTGLVEAGWLESILPMVAGAATIALTGGTATPLVAAMYGAGAGAVTGAVANRNNGQSTLMNAGLGALGGAGGAMGAGALANLGTGAAAAGGTAGIAPGSLSALSGTGSSAAMAANAGAGAAGAGAAGAGEVSAIAPGSLSALSGTGSSAATAAAVTPTQAQLMGQGLHSLAASEHPMMALSKAGYGRMGMAMSAAPVIGNAMSPGNNSSVAPKDKVRYWLTNYNQDSGRYGPSEWSDSYPGYAAGGQVQSQSMGKVDPAALQSFMNNINTQNRAPAYMNNPNSYYNPNGQPPLQPVNPPPAQPPRAVMDPGASGATSGTFNGSYNPSTGQYTQNNGRNTQQPWSMPYTRHFDGGGMTDPIDPNNPSTWSNAGNPNDGANTIQSNMQYNPSTGTYSGSSTYREPIPGKSHGPWGGFVNDVNHPFGKNNPSMDPVGLSIARRFHMMAKGGMIDGPGDGMSDSIPATINGTQPARLGSGEFVIPADVVSHLGNGSTSAGARRLQSMMAKVRHARTGKQSQAKAINVNKFMPK